MIKLPEIDYDFWLKSWSFNVGEKPIYKNKNSIKYFNKDITINQCTEEIFNLTKMKDPKKSLVLEVIDLIYAWGGPSGRMFYSSKKGQMIPRNLIEVDEHHSNLYSEGIKLAKEGNAASKDIFNKVYGIGPSYASKHAYFWSLHSNSPLIILDSKIAGSLGHRTIDDLYKLVEYSEIIKLFNEKSENVFKVRNPSKVERALFAFHDFYFKNDNSGWKRKSLQKENKDLLTAQVLAERLFES